MTNVISYDGTIHNAKYVSRRVIDMKIGVKDSERQNGDGEQEVEER